jgi:hypothetical protein
MALPRIPASKSVSLLEVVAFKGFNEEPDQGLV